MTKTNIHYSERPGKFEIRTSGSKAVVVFPVNVSEVTIEDEDGERVEYIAEKVYEYETTNTPNLADRVNRNYAKWLAVAAVPDSPKTTIADLEEAINTLTDIILGGE